MTISSTKLSQTSALAQSGFLSELPSSSQSIVDAAHCPNCKQVMRLQSLPGHYAGKVNVDVCQSCTMFWFDANESTQLSPDGVVELFQLINANKTAPALQLNKHLGCARCKQGLEPVTDRVNTGSFSYFSCAEGHGRLISFYQFLIEKKFVRTLNKNELSRLAIEVKQIKCSSCGAAVNLSTESACGYCRSPIAVFDRDAAKKAIDHYLLERKRQIHAAPPSRKMQASMQPSSSSASDGGDLAMDIVWAMAQFVSTSARRRNGSTLPQGGLPQSGLPGTTLHLGDPQADSIRGATSAELPSADEALSNMSSPAPYLGIASVGEFESVASIDPSASLGALGDFSAMLSEASLPGAVTDAAELVEQSGLAESLPEIAGSAIESLSENSGDLVDLVTDGLGSLLGALFD